MEAADDGKDVMFVSCSAGVDIYLFERGDVTDVLLKERKLRI